MRRLNILWVVVLLVLCVIWGNSLQDATRSDGLSVQVAKFFYPIVKMVSAKVSLVQVNAWIRKVAHGTEFFFLGMILTSIVYKLKAKFHYKGWIVVSGIVIVACIDESLQAFSPGRTPMIQDVLIDTVGGILGYAAYRWYRVMRQ